MFESYLIIGEIVKPQGIKGELKVKPITHDVSRFNGLESVFVERGGALVPVKVRVTRALKDAVYLFMDGVHDRNGAERMRGGLLRVDRAHALTLSEDENFISDLVGLTGVTDEGEVLGTLVDVLQPGGNDVYVFRGERTEVLVPALKSVVLRVDILGKEILLCEKRLSEVAVYDDD